MSVRPLAEADIPQVSNLYWSYMRRKKGTAPTALFSFIRELYFVNPFSDGAAPSLVYEAADGKIVGFIGGTTRRMSAGGKSIRAAYGGNLVVHPEFRSGVAAPRLISTFLAMDNDIFLSDSANEITKKVLERIEFRTIPALNLHWMRPLRPAHYAVHALSRAVGRRFSASLKFAAKPFCSLADSMAEKFPAFRLPKSRLRGTELDVETLLQCFAEFRKGYCLWPEYDARSLQWLLSFMERRPARGKLRNVLLREENGTIVGWYIYYVKPGAAGEVVQVGGNLNSTKDILNHLFCDAREQGVVGLHGTVDYRRMPDFSDMGCVFTCRGGWTMARSRNPELIKLLERGTAFLSRLDGEWCLDPGD
jgi:hypothetical protein